MRARFSELLGRGVVGAFTCYNLETAVGVLEAAEDRGCGVILLASRQSGDPLLRSLVAAANAAPVPACVELDHVSEPESIAHAFALGAGAVMADGSKLRYEENVRLVQAAAALGEVEGELGGIEGDEDVAAAVAAGALTDPEEAERFVEETRVACLAVSIGNVHGRYDDPPVLDWARLEAIRERVAIPLSLHGASGLADEDLARAITLGVRKVNVNTELREAYLAATEAELARVRAGANVLELNRLQAAAVAESVGRKLDVLG
jgi:tagatose 1,6-diphosphate aldolase GatY/KbaY